jgi:flagellar biosynthesis protein FlhG
MNRPLPILAPAAETASVPNMIAVASGKGGVGKTWFSITLAHALSRRGQRVLLFDGDLGLANVDIQLGLTPGIDLGTVLERGLPLERGAIPFASGGFDVIAGRSGSGSLAQLSAPGLHRICAGLTRLSPRYDRVIVDLGAGIERTVRSLAAHCRTCLVLATDEPTSITDAYAFIKLTLAESPTTDMRIVVNMAANPADGRRTYATLRKACMTFLKVDPPLAGIVRRDPRVKDSIRAQTPILSRHPDAPSVHDIEEVAQRIMSPPLSPPLGQPALGLP